MIGVLHGLNPHPLFNVRHYLKMRPDTSAEAIDPLVHYLLTGEAEGEQPSPFFAPEFYREKYLKKPTARGALTHYVTKGHLAKQ